jgi:hypothetical protein
LFPDEVKRDDSGCGGDGGGNGVVGHDAKKNGVNYTKLKKNPALRGEVAACQAALRGARS